jgi:hypothetical protein
LWLLASDLPGDFDYCNISIRSYFSNEAKISRLIDLVGVERIGIADYKIEMVDDKVEFFGRFSIVKMFECAAP